ncbi:MAG: hypothetical protein QG658_458 [Patescibacteria group bacterium]|jgi:hypothetical protein|nr:hypothetical protein [Patescibacteria group bacterium]
MKMPRSTHTIITLIIAAILSGLFAIGYFNMINPNDKQALKYDQQREDDFEKLSTVIQSYYTKKDKLPDSLEALKEEVERDAEARSTDSLDALTGLLAYQSVPQRDPYSNRPYTYKFENSSSTKYQLCTNFFKENKGDDDAVDKGSSETVKHGSGDQCVDFEVKKKTTRTNNSYSPSIQNAPRYDDLTAEEQQQLLDDLEAESQQNNSGSSTQN